MKLVELFLNETTDEDRAIISLAGPIYNYLQQYADRDLDWDDENNEILYVGKIGQLFNTPFKGIDDVKIVIMSDIELLQQSRKHNSGAKAAPRGIWDANTNEIIFNADYLSSDSMKSVIAHELRHMLDDIKSDFRVASSTRYITPKDKEHRKIKDDPYALNMQYLAQPAEINARFVQVLHDIVPTINRVSSLPAKEARDKLHRYLLGLMKKHNIDNMFKDKDRSPDYKRLLKRGADLIDKELANLQSQT